MRTRCLLRLALLCITLFLMAPAPADAADPPNPWPDLPPPEKFPTPPPPPEPTSSSADRVVYSNDFERTVGREWSLPITDSTPKGNHRFLGQFGNDSVALTLRDLPAHQSVLVTFDLFIIRTWDGTLGDTWALALADGRTIFRTTFSNMHEFQHRQAYPDASPGGNHPPRTGAHGRNSLGYRDRGSPRDAVYRLAFSFDHVDEILGLRFLGSGLQDLADESWGLDNVRVIVRDNPAAGPTAEERALKFDGVDDHIVIPNRPSLDLKGSLTLEARVRYDGNRGGQIIWRGDTRSDHDPYELHVHEGRMEFRIDAYFRGSHISFPARSREPVDGGWHFWTGVYDQEVGMLYLYKDGVLEAAEEIFGEITYDTSAMWNMIGAVDRGTWQHFKGAIDEVRVWNLARTPAEIHRDMTRRLTGREQGLAACWRFGPKNSQIARDLSANHNHGVLGASPFPDQADPAYDAPAPVGSKK